MTEVIKMSQELENTFNHLHRRLSNFEPVNKHIVFTKNGRERLLQVCGWLVGLSHGGQKQFASEAASDFYSKLSYLAANKELTDVTISDQTVKVPVKKILIDDDGFFNCFSFCAAYPMSTEETSENVISTLEELVTIDGAYGQRIDKTVNYKFGYNGGLIYHGPGSGQNFTVDFGGNRFWGLHT
jgi:hypothetical protein